jgi:glyoxylate/hydroxypyruvate reductase
MDILLSGTFGAREREAWRQTLAAVFPSGRWLDDAQAKATPSSVRAAVVANPAPGALQGLPALGLIQSLWAGVEGLLADPTLPPGVPLARMVDPRMNAAMAETALWAVLSLQRDFFTYADQQRQRVWRQHPQRRADETRVRVLGLGQMGRAVALALQRQGFDVAGWAATPRALPQGLAGYFGDAALPEVLAQADILVNLLPLTPATRGLLCAARFDALPPGAALVNLARGAHVVDADLLAALDAGRLRHAVLDVFASEPLPPAHAYWTHPRVTVLPHVAAATDPRSAAEVVATNLQALADGRPLAHRVDRVRGY